MTEFTDKQLIELSAVAFGAALDYRSGSDSYFYDDEEIGREQWCPLDDDRQAMGLAVKLGMNIQICIDMPFGDYTSIPVGTGSVPVIVMHEEYGAKEAVRRAITIAAACYGESI